MKLYTRTGDDGTTGLFGGQRVTKTDARVEAYGTCDELSAAIGWARVAAQVEYDALTIGILESSQRILFELGADLATPADAAARKNLNLLKSEDITQAEAWIDQACGELPEQKHFILAGGCELAARLHMARTVARRAERCTIALDPPTSPLNIVYLNRLSDLLFALARLANQKRGIDDVPWHPRQG